MNTQLKGISKEELLTQIGNLTNDTIFTEDLMNILDKHGETYFKHPNGTIVSESDLSLVGKELTFHEAFEYAKLGCFVTSELFSSDQSLHFWNNHFYYEDGAVVSPLRLGEEDWAVLRPWKIIAAPHMIDTDKLDMMHKKANGYMLYNGSYMDCINREGNEKV